MNETNHYGPGECSCCKSEKVTYISDDGMNEIRLCESCYEIRESRPMTDSTFGLFGFCFGLWVP